jgi:hypothetical protein
MKRLATILKRLSIVLATLYSFRAPAFAERWKIQYFYDEGRDTLVIEDLAFPTGTHGIAVGTILDELSRKKPRYVALVSGDGGARWTTKELPEHPRSIFFLNESEGWMVTDDSFWFTETSGSVWKRIAPQIKPDKKISQLPGGLITRVWFLDSKHGFAVGLQKSVYESKDGGATWTPVAAAAQPPGDPKFTAYTQIYFEGEKPGMIYGASTPPRRDDPNLPEWMEPERAVKRRKVPMLALTLKTVDGGVSWKSETSEAFGSLSNVCLAGADGLSVYQYDQSFDSPSEVYHLDARAGKVTGVYHDKLRVMDCALFKGPHGFLAAVEPPGRLNTAPIPGKVKILSSTNLKDWTEMDVDYKANARSLIIAGPDAEHLWVATDTGMILHLLP